MRKECRLHGFGLSYGGWGAARVAFLEHGGPQTSNPSYSPRKKVRGSCLLWGVPLNLAFLVPVLCHLQLIKYNPRVGSNPRLGCVGRPGGRLTDLIITLEREVRGGYSVLMSR